MLATIDPEAPVELFPPLSWALGPESTAPGLLAAGGDLSVARLLAAYRRGIFPWFSLGQPILWWSPDPRMVLHCNEFRVSASLKQTLRRFADRAGHEIRLNHRFDRVIQHCAQLPRDGQNGTWIVPRMIAAYQHLHQAGYAHSVETWINGELAGGLYGVRLGRMFFGESMFALQRDASKIALAALVALCRRDGLPLIDCQQNTAHMASLGAREVNRGSFARTLDVLCEQDAPPPWAYDQSLWKHLL